MIEGIIASLVAAGIAAAITFLYRCGYLHVIIDEVMFHISPSGVREQRLLPKETTAIQTHLVRRLLRDQSRFGQHRGQFGKSCDALHSEKWQAKGSGENLNLKPRIYLTYWPVIILHKHGLAPRSVNLAITGVAALFTDGRIPVYTSAPESSPTKRELKWNHRHSMAGAHLLAIDQPNNNVTLSVIDQMLDHRNSWQESSGGWWQTSDKKNQPDLWASVYALKLLDFVSSTGIEALQKQTSLVQSAIERTLSYLETEWDTRHWGESGKLLTEENLVSMFIDLAPILLRYSPRLGAKCIAAMKEWLSPGGDLSKGYLATLETQATPICAEQAYARMAYAFHLSQDDSVNWRPWFEKAARCSRDRLFSSELAFLLDISFKYKE
jgi:hypothetical protein